MSDSKYTESGIQSLVDMLHHMDAQEQAKLLKNVSERDPILAEKLRSRLFVFQDLLFADSQGLQELLRQVATDQLAMALRIADEELKSHLSAHLTKRAAESLKESLENLGPQRVQEVMKAQEEIVKKAKTLIADGKMAIQRDTDPKEFTD